MKEYQAHPYSKAAHLNREAIKKSKWVGCYGCITIYPASRIDKWTDGEQTALCGCMIDAVLADAEVSFDEALLRRLHNHWFA